MPASREITKRKSIFPLHPAGLPSPTLVSLPRSKIVVVVPSALSRPVELSAAPLPLDVVPPEPPLLTPVEPAPDDAGAVVTSRVRAEPRVTRRRSLAGRGQQNREEGACAHPQQPSAYSPHGLRVAWSGPAEFGGKPWLHPTWSGAACRRDAARSARVHAHGQGLWRARCERSERDGADSDVNSAGGASPSLKSGYALLADPGALGIRVGQVAVRLAAATRVRIALGRQGIIDADEALAARLVVVARACVQRPVLALGRKYWPADEVRRVLGGYAHFLSLPGHESISGSHAWRHQPSVLSPLSTTHCSSASSQMGGFP